MDKELDSKDSNVWSFILSLFFVGLVILFIYILQEQNVDYDMEVFEFIILALATFRLIRLVVYDSIFQFARDIVLDKKSVWNAKEELYIITRETPKKGLRRKIAQLIDCPWCAGVWLALLVIFFFYLTPLSWFVFLALAIAGTATSLQIILRNRQPSCVSDDK